MVRMPSKLYNVQESTLWQMREICQAIPEQGITVRELYRQNAGYSIDDFVDAMTCLYAIDAIVIENQIVRRNVTRDTL